jgi:uncharacterized protein (DUF58 family)
LPTGFGVIYGLSLFLMLLMAYTYQNNLGYAFTFFLGSFGLAAMFATHRQMSRFHISNTESVLVEEGQKIPPPLRDTNPQDSPEAFRLRPRDNPQVIEAAGRWLFQKRGRQEIPVVEVHSSYPMGLFRTWKRVPTKTIVYCSPRPEDHGLLPGGFAAISEEKLESHRHDAGELRGLALGRREDPPSAIDWRALARGRGFAKKDFEDDSGLKLQLRWVDTQTLEDPEKRLRQFAAWIKNAREQRIPFFVELPSGRWTSSEEDALRDLAAWTAP